MNFLSHRGLWKNKEAQNTLVAFQDSFIREFGVELDIRNCQGQLVISHDIPTGSCLLLEEVFECYNDIGLDVTIAVNVKADGLQELLKEAIDKYSISNYFAFDMSVADTLRYSQHQLKFFTRQSEYEQQPPLFDRADGVWLDCFEGDWWTPQDVEPHIQQGKLVALVSPELHGREYQTAWEVWRGIEREMATDRLMLCTDFPEQARAFFEQSDL